MPVFSPFSLLSYPAIERREKKCLRISLWVKIFNLFAVFVVYRVFFCVQIVSICHRLSKNSQEQWTPKPTNTNNKNNKNSLQKKTLISSIYKSGFWCIQMKLPEREIKTNNPDFVILAFLFAFVWWSKTECNFPTQILARLCRTLVVYVLNTHFHWGCHSSFIEPVSSFD